MGVISTQGFVFRLLAGDDLQQLDLFKDEDIKISNNVTGIFDVGLLPTDFSRQLTLPGTKNNNAFFEHVYDISILNPFLFATNVKVPCRFDFGSFYLVDGYIQLNKVNVIANKFIDSYEVTIYGALSSFARDINLNFLTDLTSLAQYNHTASYANISQSWDTGSGLFNGDIVYPLADYGNGIEFTPSNPYTGIDSNEGALYVQDFKPAIRIKKVWDAIFDYAGYTYSSSFMAQPWLDDVYMICNNALRYPEFAGLDLETLGQIRISPISGSNQTNLFIPKATITNLPWYNVERDPSLVVGTNSVYSIRIDNPTSLTGIINLDINVSGSLGAPTLYFHVKDTGSLATVSTTTLVSINDYFYNQTFADFAAGNTGQNLTSTVQQQFVTSIINPGTYFFAIEWIDAFGAPYNNFIFTLDPSGNPRSYLEITKVNQAADGLIMDIPSNMPYGTSGIKLVDFILGIQKKFNLVIYPNLTKRNEFIVETFNDWYTKGQRWDFNKYINLDKNIEVSPVNNFAVNRLNFSDTLDQDYISQQFAKGANREYGKLYYIDTQNFFSQGEFNVKTTFASEPLRYVVGTGITGSSGTLPPPFTYQWKLGNAGEYAAVTACQETYYFPNTVYAASNSYFGVTTFYTDTALTTPFNGSNSYWKGYLNGSTSYYAFYIGADGTVYDVADCAAF